MRILTLLAICFSCLNLNAQVAAETTLSRCPVFITDTVSANNFFIGAETCDIESVSGKRKAYSCSGSEGTIGFFLFS